MPREILDPISIRITALRVTLKSRDQQRTVEEALRSADGDWRAARSRLAESLPPSALRQLDFAHDLAELSNDHVSVVRALSANAAVNSLRDVALTFNTAKLAELVDADALPDDIAGADAATRKLNFANSINRKLFAVEPTAVLQRMVRDAEVPVADLNVRTGITAFLDNQPRFNIRTTSIYSALKEPAAFNGIHEEHRMAVADHLKTLQRVQALTDTPDALPVLMNANLTSAFRVAQIPESTFMSAYSHALGAETAQAVYTHATNAQIRNEHALITMREALKGTGLAIIDGNETLAERVASMQTLADRNGVPVNLETLFGSLDHCDCDECLSVYSPAAYFVELLQFLRNNNLDPANPNTGQKGIANTPLEKLFRRRPDLGCLELTCENSYTVLPYIDLVNEVMENFVVHLDKYHADQNVPKQATLPAFNIDGETSSELLAQARHTNYEAYCILKNAVHPFTLPYHQPIDATRIFLGHLGTTRREIIDAFRAASEGAVAAGLGAAEQAELATLHPRILDRAVDSEALELTQEEFIIFTKEAFWLKRYFDITQQRVHTEAEYRTNIGVKPVHEYYGCAAESDMLSADESKQLGLTFVRKQFLPRTGIAYVDLVALLKTRFINPNAPDGQALKLLQSIHFSYRFLQTLVDAAGTDPAMRYAKLIGFLEKTQPWLPLLDAMLHPDPCHAPAAEECGCDAISMRDWVLCYFERLGGLIVLDSGEGPRLPISGLIFKESAPPEHIATLRSDGTILDLAGVVIGQVDMLGVPRALDGTAFATKVGQSELMIKSEDGAVLGFMSETMLRDPRENRITWLPAHDTCNLDKVRLVHLDGSPVTVDEYDRIHRFLRLWRKLGWTIDEVDQAIWGLAKPRPPQALPGKAGAEAPGFVGFDRFEDDCRARSDDDGSDAGCDEGCPGIDCPPARVVDCDITPAFLHQLVAVRRLLDVTGLPLAKLLTFWADIGTAGEKSLYERLFLTHNLQGIDAVFRADDNGAYLTKALKISDHLPVLMAGLKLKADDIDTIRAYRGFADALTLANVSALYRDALIAKALQVRVSALPEVFALLGDPFVSADAAVTLFDRWATMEEAGFKFPELNYLVRGRDDTLRPLAPSARSMLQLGKALYDGLTAIDRDHADFVDDELATRERVRAKTSLLFEPAVVERIAGLLEGTTIYTTNAPANLTLAIPPALATRVKYANVKDAVPPGASLQVTGILTDALRTQAKALSTNPDWGKALDRAEKQARRVIDDVLFGALAGTADEGKALLVGDSNDPEDAADPANTATAKRAYILKAFLPFLRRRLAEHLVVEKYSSAASLSADATQLLLGRILTSGTPPKAAMDVVVAINDEPPSGGTGWKGYLIPPADDEFVFVAVGDTQPAALRLDGASIVIGNQQEDPTNVWTSEPVRLKAGRLHWLEVADRPASALQWKTAVSPRAAIPSGALLPDHSSQATTAVFVALQKAALLVNALELSTDESEYFQQHGADFAGFDFNAPSLPAWLRLTAYTSLRAKLPKAGTPLLSLFRWASEPGDVARLVERIAGVTAWRAEDIEKLLAPAHFDARRVEEFRNEIVLARMHRAMTLGAKVGVDLDRLFGWAKPGSKFWACHAIAEDIRKAVRARYDQEDWEKVVNPLNDRLRENQKRALIAYLLVQHDLIDWGVTDADGLFEFFLIDVQMDACMETSRIKQGLCTLQLFIDRCCLGLEERFVGGAQVGVPSTALDRKRLDWMKQYRVWEANRKVFLYPENILLSELRDDRTEPFLTLQSGLLQKNLEPRVIEDAVQSYVFKLDTVANLDVVGLFHEEQKLHVIGCTRNAPYLFYYRYFSYGEQNWYPWERMDLDIPVYSEEAGGEISSTGAYVTPVVLNSRLLVFFPMFLKKTVVKSTTSSETPEDMAGKTVGDSKPDEFFEIKLAWSEYRNRKWTPKQVSADAIYSKTSSAVFTGQIHHYNFVPRLVGGANPAVTVEVLFNGNDKIGKFRFTGNQLFRDETPFPNLGAGVTDFQAIVSGTQMHSLQTTGSAVPALMKTEPFFKMQDSSVTGHIAGKQLDFYHEFSHDLVSSLAAGGLPRTFDYLLNGVADTADGYGKNSVVGASPSYHELKAPYAIYNWELGYHAPMLIVERLLKGQQFEAALRMCQNILDPFAGDPADATKAWKFWPFRQFKAEHVIEELFASLKPNQPDAAINEWRDKPFQPHVVARGRPTAYMKRAAMKYIEILIEWGDYLFREDTIESINRATQLYVLAAHVYGPAGHRIPKRGKVQTQTYNSLLDKWDAFSNAMVEMELVFPFSNQTPLPIGASNGVVGLANIFGFATTLYFCLPDNPQLRALNVTIDDRLFKLRHCENIEGVFRKLPLFEPPIDPLLLAQVAAQGLSIESVVNDLNTAQPNYRFLYLLQKAIELCGELRNLGSALLTAREKRDAEELMRLRARHESVIHGLVLDVRERQIEEAQRSLDALLQSREGPAYRMRHYLALAGEDLAKIPREDADFRDISVRIDAPAADGDLKVSLFEKEEMDKAKDASEEQEKIGEIEVLASILSVIPTIGVNLQPLGMGPTLSYGGSNLAAAAQAVARSKGIIVGNRTFDSTNAARKANLQRQLQERMQLANSAGYELKQIDRQIVAQRIRIDVAEHEKRTQQQQVDHAREIEEYLEGKVTNQELFEWMDGSLQGLYQQAYTLANDLARKAEKLFRFERGLTTSNYIQPGYWDAGHDGLLAGERLLLGLKQLEAAYLEKRGHDFEIAKSISLRQIHPLALIQLKQTGTCEFSLPEVLFDMDCPGHYLRRIKSVALTVPCIVGPYTSVNCTLRLLEHKYRTSAIAKDKADYPEKLDETDERFATTNVPITAMVASSGQHDTGLFELSLRDERYLPFEGAGVISKWRLELPKDFRQFDYNTITDCVIELRYTAVDGGDKLRKPAADSVREYVKNVEDLSREEGLFAYFDLAHDFANEWFKALQPPADATERVIELARLNERLPVFTKGRKPEKIPAADVYLFTTADLAPGALKLTQGPNELAFSVGPAYGELKSFVSKDAECPMGDWQLKVQDTATKLEDLSMVVRYTLR